MFFRTTGFEGSCALEDERERNFETGAEKHKIGDGTKKKLFIQLSNVKFNRSGKY